MLLIISGVFKEGCHKKLYIHIIIVEYNCKQDNKTII